MSADKLLSSAPIAVSSDQVATILLDTYGMSGEISPLPGERDRNFLVTTADGEYSLKVANPAERVGVLDMQQRALRHMRDWEPELPVPIPVATRNGELATTIAIDATTVPVRLATYLSGQTVEDVGYNPPLRAHAMQTLARIDRALRTFSHRDLSRPLLWNPMQVLDLRPFVEYLHGDKRQVAESWLRHFEASLKPRLCGMVRQPIHGDFNPANLIVDPANPEVLAGVVDLGDMTTAPAVVDVAIAAAYQCLGEADPAGALVNAAAAYHATNPLEIDEAGLIADLAITRLVQSLLISAWRSELHPDNRDYILMHATPVWDSLWQLAGAPAGVDLYELRDRIGSACAAATLQAPDLEESLRRRRRRLGPGMRLTYDRPLQVASGSGVHLTDTGGVRYLDAYNNVAHVGHGNPDVVKALADQAARLNTNTRYLVDDVTAYADRLAALFPDPLEVVFFANSGSEANDLAWRIARTVTDRKGMIVTEHAYHGSTYLTMATSPEELGLANLEGWVATVHAPWPGSDGEKAVVSAAAHLASHNEKPAAFVCDTVFSSDGILEPPGGYLAAVYQTVRAFGGLCIADEVQAGFGRVGARMWGFAGHDVIPDIVTLGKPIGNGHPLAAVVTTEAIAAEFARTGYYFSTFAGNPVSAAVGAAVLDVMERDDLANHAERVGAYLRRGLAEIAAIRPVVAQVRGPGMFIGVDLALAGEPASDLARRVQNEMRNRRVLIGRTGPGGNVLKIRPPLVFNDGNADELLAILDAVLGEV